SDVASIARKVVTDRRVFIVREFGWDVNNWKTTTELQNLLDEFLKDSNISGDMFWCLRGHSTDHGYMPVPNPAPASYTRSVPDIDGCWNDPNPVTTNKWYRVIPYNLDGVAGRPSQPVRHLESPMRDR